MSGRSLASNAVGFAFVAAPSRSKNRASTENIGSVGKDLASVRKFERDRGSFARQHSYIQETS
jgi:hypothetical protein